MTGLNPCQEFYPWGYNNPLEPPAQKISAAPLAPNEYNRNAIRGPSRARRIVPVPVAGPMHPPLRGQDFYGDKNAAGLLPWPQNPKSFNVNAIGTNYKTTYPILTPWSREAAKSQVVDSMNGGSIEPPKDLRTVAETFAKTSSDEKEREWWERRVNALSQLEAITITRGLNPQEQQLKNEIFKEISDRSANTSTITASLAAAHIPKSAPATAAEISALLNAMGNMAPPAPGQVPVVPGSSIPPTGNVPPGGVVHIRDPPDYGPPQGPYIIDYTSIPRLEWPSPAVPGFAFYIERPEVDKGFAIKNLRAYYKDTPTVPAKIPGDEMELWKMVTDIGIPKGRRKSGESDIDFIARANDEDLDVLWAYLAHPNWFPKYMSEMKDELPDLIVHSVQQKFPKHPGMHLGPIDYTATQPGAAAATQVKPPSTPPTSSTTPSPVAESLFSILAPPAVQTPIQPPPGPLTRAAQRVQAALTPKPKKGKKQS